MISMKSSAALIDELDEQKRQVKFITEHLEATYGIPRNTRVLVRVPTVESAERGGGQGGAGRGDGKVATGAGCAAQAGRSCVRERHAEKGKGPMVNPALLA